MIHACGSIGIVYHISSNGQKEDKAQLGRDVAVDNGLSHEQPARAVSRTEALRGLGPATGRSRWHLRVSARRAS